MKKVIHKADTRGHSQYDWLDSYHTFSFDEYFDSDRINFGALPFAPGTAGALLASRIE